MVFAFTHPTPDREAVIVHDGISWPISSKAEAFRLCRQVGLPGFWRLKARPSNA